jgi:hypothetical protein
VNIAIGLLSGILGGAVVGMMVGTHSARLASKQQLDDSVHDLTAWSALSSCTRFDSWGWRPRWHVR